MNPTKHELSIADIKINLRKPHRLLIVYQFEETSIVAVHSIYKNRWI